MNRGELIQTLIRQRNYRSYLEIGCQSDQTFGRIQVERKVGVDPVSGGTLRMESDEFFLLAAERYDLIFIDGDHRHPQVMRDVSNSLRVLAPGGAIVMHDCLPPNEGFESPDRCGTVWRVFAKIRERPDLDAVTLDDDYGVGVVQVRTNRDPISVARSMDDLSYEDFSRNRDAWMRPHKPADLLRYLGLSE